MTGPGAPAPGGFPGSSDELLARVHDEREALERCIAELGVEALVTPGFEAWSVKDHLAHIATWERILLVRHIGGGSFSEATGMDEATSRATEHMSAETGRNDYFQRRDRGLLLTEVMRVFDDTHRRVLEVLRDTPFAQLSAPVMARHVAGNTYEHYAEHREIIERHLS